MGGVPLLLPLPPIGEHFLLESRRPRAYVLGDRIRDRCFYPWRVEEVAACTDKPAMMDTRALLQRFVTGPCEPWAVPAMGQEYTTGGIAEVSFIVPGQQLPQFLLFRLLTRVPSLCFDPVL